MSLHAPASRCVCSMGTSGRVVWQPLPYICTCPRCRMALLGLKTRPSATLVLVVMTSVCTMPLRSSPLQSNTSRPSILMAHRCLPQSVPASTVFANWRCPQFIETCEDLGGTDKNGHTCDWYVANPCECGKHDPKGWSASSACCQCGGGGGPCKGSPDGGLHLHCLTEVSLTLQYSACSF